MKVAGAPISWGVSELLGWGHRMAPARVLREMRELGLHATELGPPGYLPEEPGALRELLDGVGVSLVAGFLAAVLHDPHLRASALGNVERVATALAESGAEQLILAAALPGDSYDRRGRLHKEGWVALAATLAAAEDLAAAHGIGLAFHPHAGTAVEREEEVTMLLEMTNVALCLDTGHLFLGGADPAQVARDAGARVRHVHMKDVDAELAARVRSGELAYAAAVRSGLYRPLGQGDLDLKAVVGWLQDAGYQGWYVLEQDVALAAEPEPAGGPIAAARQSLEFFRALSGAKQPTNAFTED
jgi:inosose dehydratase